MHRVVQGKAGLALIAVTQAAEENRKVGEICWSVMSYDSTPIHTTRKTEREREEGKCVCV